VIWRALDWFIPAEQLGAGARSARRARAIVGFCWIGIASGFGFTPMYGILLAPDVRFQAACTLAGFAVVLCAVLFLGRRWWPVQAGGVTVYAIVALALCAMIWFTGGSDSPAIWWYILLPMFTLIEWERWQSVAAMACGGALVVGWHYLDAGSHPVGLDITEEVNQSLRFIVQIGLFVAVAALTLAFQISRDGALLALARTNIDLERAGNEAIAASAVKSAFLANMSHELRTPLTAILGFTDASLEQLETGSERWTWLDIVRRNGQHMLELINDILDLSRIEADKLELECTRFSVFELLAEVASLMRVRAEANGVALLVHFATPLPEYIETDPRRARQILINLVGNAIKFTEVGAVTLSAALVRSECGARIEIKVTDTGIGMTDAQLLALFAPFTQGDSSTSRKYGGSGLGLAISQSLARKFGGTISAASTVGVGSEFRFSIPTGVGQEVPRVTRTLESVLDEMSARVKRGATAVGRCLGRSVLLADDGRDNQILIGHLLRRAGATVTVVENGQAAVDYALAAARDDQPYDIVLMDIQMPVLDGHAATRALRARGYAQRIVALTASAMAGDRERALAAGCDDFLAKPIDGDALLAAVAGTQGEKPVAG
jgi:signal transduction histidine kinase/ActR/RegA family two-component response regulator